MSSSTTTTNKYDLRGKKFTKQSFKRHNPPDELPLHYQPQPKKQAMIPSAPPSSSSDSPSSSFQHIFKVRDWVCIPMYKGKKRAGIITHIDEHLRSSGGKIKMNVTVDINTGGTRPFLVDWPIDKIIWITKRSNEYDIECSDIKELEAASDSSPSSSPVSSSLNSIDCIEKEKKKKICEINLHSYLHISLQEILDILKNKYGSFDSMEPTCKEVVKLIKDKFDSMENAEQIMINTYCTALERLAPYKLWRSDKVNTAQNNALEKLEFWHQDGLNSFVWNKWWNSSTYSLSARRLNEILTCSDESFNQIREDGRDYLSSYRDTFKEFVEMALAARKANPDNNHVNLSSYTFDKFKQKLSEKLTKNSAQLESGKVYEAMSHMHEACFHPLGWQNAGFSFSNLIDRISQGSSRGSWFPDNWVAIPMKYE